MSTISSLSPWGIVQFLIVVIMAGFAYYYKKADKDRDSAIKDHHEALVKITDGLNKVNLDFTVTKTQFDECHPCHKQCLERIGRLESKVEICERLKGGR